MSPTHNNVLLSHPIINIQIKTLGSVSIAAEINRAFTYDDLRLIGIGTTPSNIEGTTQNMMIQDIKVIAGTSSKEKSKKLNKVAHNYAKKYNAIMIQIRAGKRKMINGIKICPVFP